MSILKTEGEHICIKMLIVSERHGVTCAYSLSYNFFGSLTLSSNTNLKSANENNW